MTEIRGNEDVKFIDISLIDIECHCECHSNPNVMHVMECCDQCPKCGRNIKSEWFVRHIETCGTGKLPHL